MFLIILAKSDQTVRNTRRKSCPPPSPNTYATDDRLLTLFIVHLLTQMLCFCDQVTAAREALLVYVCMSPHLDVYTSPTQETHVQSSSVMDVLSIYPRTAKPLMVKKSLV